MSCNLQRAARSRDTATVRNWMRAVVPRRGRRQRDRSRWPNAHSSAQTNARALDELRQHRPCGFADRDHIDGGAARQNVSDRRVAERSSYEHRRISRTHGCPEDVLQVSSKMVNGTNQ
jgi:hypothetical protein